MQNWTAQPLLDRKFMLGEGPCWNEKTGELSWVDIKMGALMILGANGELRELQLGQYLGAAIPTVQGNFVALLTTGIYLTDGKVLTKKLLTPENMGIEMRFNDAKCDCSGRLWAGTMSLFSRVPPTGRLYRIGGTARCTEMLSELGISNGMAWTADRSTMYFIDTMTGGVDAFDFDAFAGTISNRRRVIDVENGKPDGMTIDSEDKLWVAIYGGSEVRRYDPATGECIGRVSVDAPNVTSCCFGGEDLQTLYITTAGEKQDAPGAGKVYSVRCGVKGTPTWKFDERWVNEA